MQTPLPTAFTVFGYGFTLGGNSRQAIEGLAEDVRRNAALLVESADRLLGGG